MKAVQDEKFLEDAYLQPQLNMILQIIMAAGPGKVMSTLPEHLKAMGQRYSHPVLSTGAGRRVMNADVWNHGLKKNMPHHYKVEVPSWPNVFLI